MIPLDALLAIGSAIALASYAYGYVTGRCSKANPCKKCSFHVNEQRVERMEAERLRVEEATKQAELRHDAEHKGWGWATGAKDTMNCADEACSRNKPKQ